MKKSAILLGATVVAMAAYASPEVPAFIPGYVASSLTSHAQVKNASDDGNMLLAPTNLTSRHFSPKRVKEDGVIIPPYIETFDSEESLEGWTVKNVNNDNRYWRWRGEEGGRAAIPTWNLYDPATDNKDWLFSLPIKVEAGKKYKIGAFLWGGSGEIERLTVKAGLKPNGGAMDQTVVPLTEYKRFSGGDGYYIEGLMIAPADTLMYLGFFCTSPASSWLMMDNLTISAGYDDNGPAAPQINSVKGVLETTKANISVTAPTTCLNNEPLEGKMDVSIMRDYQIIASFKDVDPGQELTATDEVAEAGIYSYQTYATGGETSTPTNAFLGLEKPGAPSNIKITELPEGKAQVTWTANLNGQSGYPINTNRFTYSIYDKDQKLIKDSLPEPSCIFQVSFYGEQAMAQYYVSVSNSEGESVVWPAQPLPIGSALTFPLQESFTETLMDIPMAYEEPMAQSSWYTVYDGQFSGFNSYDKDNGCLFCVMLNYIDTIYTNAVLPKILVPNDGEAKFSFFLYNLKDPEIQGSNFMRIKAMCDGELTVLGSGYIDELCDGKDGWKQFEYDLSQFYGKEIYLLIELTEPNIFTTPFDLFQFSGVSSVQEPTVAPSVTETGRYAIDGTRVEPDAKGLVIVTYSNGTARKMIAK